MNKNEALMLHTEVEEVYQAALKILEDYPIARGHVLDNIRGLHGVVDQLFSRNTRAEELMVGYQQMIQEFDVQIEHLQDRLYHDDLTAREAEHVGKTLASLREDKSRTEQILSKLEEAAHGNEESSGT